MTETVWKKAYDLYQQTNVDWGWFDPVRTRGDGVDCYCAGGALAKVITGDAHAMYARPNDYDFSPELEVALDRFADHVGVGFRAGPPYQRVYKWNDSLLRDERGREAVLKALMELHEAEVAS